MTTDEAQQDRKRVQDVYESLHEEVFPRLGAIDTKLTTLEHGVNNILISGCPQRAHDMRRTEQLEAQIGKIFEKIDGFGTFLSEHRVDVTRQIGGIRIWVLGGCVVVLLGLLGFLAPYIFK
jgi:hypothetical protein